MLLIYGVLCLCAFIFLISISALVCRNPHTSEWLNNGISFIALPFLVGLMAAGVAMIASFVMSFSSASLNFTENSMELITSGAIILVTLVAVKALRLKKRLAAYNDMGAAQVIGFNGTGPSTTPPQQPRPVNRAA